MQVLLILGTFLTFASVADADGRRPNPKRIYNNTRYSEKVSRFEYKYYEAPLDRAKLPYLDVSFNTTAGQIKVYASRGGGKYPNATNADMSFTDLASAIDFFTLDVKVEWSLSVYGYTDASFDIYRSTTFVQQLKERVPVDARTPKRYNNKWWTIQVPANVDKLSVLLNGTAPRGSNMNIADFDLGLTLKFPMMDTNNTYRAFAGSSPYMAACLRVQNPKEGVYYANNALVRSPMRDSPSTIQFGFNDKAPC